MSAPHQPLLGRLAVWFNEVIVTDALRLVLDHPGNMQTFVDFVGRAADTDLSMVRTFEREHVIDDGRIDLEGIDAEGRPRLLIEAKLGHLITAEQMERYLAHQHTALAGVPGVLMLLVPASRVPEARAVLDTLATGLAQGQAIRPVVLSWDECLQAIADHLPEGERGPVSPAADVAQLQALCRAFSGWVLPPSIVPDRHRDEHLRGLLEKLTARLRPQLSSTSRLVNIPGHTYRYFGVDDAENYVSIGLAPGLEPDHGTPFWLWLPHGTRDFTSWRNSLRRSAYRDQLVEMGDALWLPLHIDADLGGPELVEHLAAQALAILTLLHPPAHSRAEPG